jgi:RHS repeat-associated protein
MTTVAGLNNSVTYIYTDGLGSPVARMDGAGTVISRTRYEPYGYVASGVQPTIGFTGHVNDVDTGLTYMQKRYYDPLAGRFLSIDPVVTDANSGGSFNRYANNSPYNILIRMGDLHFCYRSSLISLMLR